MTLRDVLGLGRLLNVQKDHSSRRGSLGLQLCAARNHAVLEVMPQLHK